MIDGFFFFFKQKTAYELRISDWSSDVCSSDLFGARPCYRCLVPEIPPEAETCAVVGVVGALAGVVGSMMALEALKLIVGAGETLAEIGRASCRERVCQYG